MSSRRGKHALTTLRAFASGDSSERLAPFALFLVVLLSGCSAVGPDRSTLFEDWERAQRTYAEPEGDAETTGLDPSSDIHQLLEHARQHNPGLRAAFHRWRAALEHVSADTALPRPRLMVGYYVNELETRVGPLEARLSLSQRFPWFGQLSARERTAVLMAEAAREAFEAMRLELEGKVLDIWYERAWLEQAIEIAEAHQDLLSNWEAVARTRLESGLGSHPDLIRAQVELGKLENQAESLRSLRIPLGARLNALLDRAPEEPLPAAMEQWPEAESLDLEALRAGLTETSPKLRAIRHRIEASEQGVELSKKTNYPDLVLGVEYVFVGEARMPGVSGSGDDPVALTLGIDLPIWSAVNESRVRGGEASAEAYHQDRRQILRSLESELEMDFYRFEDAKRRLQLFKDLVPKGEEGLQAISSSYESGSAGFLDLIEAQRTLLEFRFQTIRAHADICQAATRIQVLCGTGPS